MDSLFNKITDQLMEKTQSLTRLETRIKWIVDNHDVLTKQKIINLLAEAESETDSEE